jgi:hypothetical protein
MQRISAALVILSLAAIALGMLLCDQTWDPNWPLDAMILVGGSALLLLSLPLLAWRPGTGWRNYPAWSIVLLLVLISFVAHSTPARDVPEGHSHVPVFEFIALIDGLWVLLLWPLANYRRSKVAS